MVIIFLFLNLTLKGCKVHTEGCCDVSGQNHNGSTNHEPLHIRSETNDVIRYGYSDNRAEDIDEQFCQCFTQIVDISAVHSVEMFPQENGNFQSESLRDKI